MIDSGTAFAAVFPNKTRAADYVEALKENGFAAPWMALVKPAPLEDPTTAWGTKEADAKHDVRESSSGVIGAIGRFFTDEASLRKALTDQGLSAQEAASIDERMPVGGAVVVVEVIAGELRQLAMQLANRCGASPFPEPSRSQEASSSDAGDPASHTVAGQANDQDRGTHHEHRSPGTQKVLRDPSAAELATLHDLRPAPVPTDF